MRKFGYEATVAMRSHKEKKPVLVLVTDLLKRTRWYAD